MSLSCLTAGKCLFTDHAARRPTGNYRAPCGRLGDRYPLTMPVYSGFLTSRATEEMPINAGDAGGLAGRGPHAAEACTSGEIGRKSYAAQRLTTRTCPKRAYLVARSRDATTYDASRAEIRAGVAAHATRQRGTKLGGIQLRIACLLCTWRGKPRVGLFICNQMLLTAR